ncbi:MAG: MraY family glycosyltransferase [Candidatus Omnitrophica bacterium]|nr:MraY family glycosyltransferase [Candidatus Omnitrophota bacterium]
MMKGIPLVGGLGIALAFILGSLGGLFIFKVISKEITGILLASTAMLIFGLFDDRKELSIKTKFIVQIIASTILILSGVRTNIIYIGTLANIAITLIWVIGITNAFNHLDIMDGLAAAVAVIVSGVFLAAALINQDIKSLILALALLSGVFSFLIYNLPPAKVYMGNSGSHFLGFVLSAVAIVISYAPMERKIALLSPILILGFPIFDTVFVSILRLKKNILPFKKSNDHLALLFLRLGFSKNKALGAMLLLTLSFSLSGLALMKVSNLSGMILILVIVFVSMVFINRMAKLKVND